MKIAIVHPSLAVKGGAENVAVWLAASLKRRGHQVTVFTETYDASLWDDRYTRGLECHLLKLPAYYSVVNSTWLRTFGMARELRRHLQGFDVVNCHVHPSNLWVARARGSSRSFPRTVWYCQEPNRKTHWRKTEPHLVEYAASGAQPGDHMLQEYEREISRAERSTWHRLKRVRDARRDCSSVQAMDVVLVNSEFTKGRFEAVYGVAPRVCYLGIPTDPAPECPARRGDYFCVVSPLRWKKNVHSVIEAMDILVHRWGLERVHLKVVGDGAERSHVEALTAERGLGSQVEFLGRVPDGELPGVYARARLSVYVPIDEPFGLVALESMLHGTPAIVSNHGGLCESVVHGETGLHVNPFDPEAIAAAVRELYFDDDRIAAMGARGAERVRERFSLERFVDRFEAMALADQPSRGGDPRMPDGEARRLNVGCGRDVRAGYVNLDRFPLHGVDVVHDLESFPYPFDDNCFDEIVAQDVLEHLHNTVQVMEELWRILKPGGTLAIRVPHARSANAAHDPTHVSMFTERTFDYFADCAPDRVLAKYNFYTRARFEIESLRVERKYLRILGSRRLARLLLGHDVEMHHGNVYCVLRKIAPRQPDTPGESPS